jgi:hypothetical protein
MGRLEEAEVRARESLAFGEAIGIQLEVGYARMVLAALRAQGTHPDWQEAFAFVADARQIFEKVGSLLDVGLADLAEARILGNAAWATRPGRVPPRTTNGATH